MRPCLPPALVLILMAPACSGPRMAYNAVDPKGLTGLRTVALAPPSDTVVVLEGMRPVAPGFLPELVLEGLRAKGFVQAPPDAADLLLRVQLFAEAGEGSGGGGPRGGGRGGGRGMGHSQRQGGPEEGPGGGPQGAHGGPGGPPQGDLSLVVHLLDRNTGTLKWGGTLVYPAARRKKGGPGAPELVRQFLEPIPAVR